MPGLRHFNFRQGDRTEYLAQYFLSALGIAARVPREEDVGIDFHCSLARKNNGRLTFFAPYNVQTKSSGPDSLVYGGIDKSGRHKRHEIEWLLSQTVPFFLALVDKTGQKLDLFQTSSRWFVRYDPLIPVSIRFELYKPEGEAHLGNGERKAWADEAEAARLPADVERVEWSIPLGQPVLSLTIDEAENQETVAQRIDSLATYVAAESHNVTLAETGQMHFRWPLVIRTNQAVTEQGILVAWTSTPTPQTRGLLRTMTPIVAAVMKTLEAAGHFDQVSVFQSIVPMLPRDPDLSLVHQMIEQALEAAKRRESP